MKGCRPIPVILFCLALISASPSPAAVTQGEAQRVCLNWLSYVACSENLWSGHANPHIRRVEPLMRGKELLGWQFVINPRGYVVVPSRRELSPIHTCSETAKWEDDESNPFLPFILETLGERFDQLDADDLGEVDQAVRRNSESAPLHRAWLRYDRDPQRFQTDLAANVLRDIEEAGPLLRSAWHQDLPFNLLCPTSGAQHTYVGCTALATAQIMNYHAWPPWGVGTTGYEWDGDDCAPETECGWLEADLEDPFDWAIMPDVVTPETTEEEQQALAHLCYDVSVACRMDFSICGSAASSSMARAALINQFHYQQGAREVVRFRYTTAGWFAEIQDDIDQGLPILYSTVIHTLVCDGWRDVDGLQQIHLNYGWGGASDNWYSLDDIETSLNPYAERMILDMAPDTTAVFPLNVMDFEVEETLSGMELEWEVPDNGRTAEFTVLRSGGSPHGCVPLPLNDAPLTGETEYEYLDATVESGDYDYWLKALSAVGEEIWFGPVRAAVTVGVEEAPPPTGLTGLAPNPANPRAVIAFSLGASCPVRLTVVDPRGRRVSLLVDKPLPAGDHEQAWDGRGADGRAAPSGVYFLHFEADGHRETRKLLLAR